MYIIADKRIPFEAKMKLKQFGNVLFFESGGITYPAISGHPDIFFCKTRKELVIAPNIPDRFNVRLNNLNISISAGRKVIGNRYPETAAYNAVVTDKHLIHNFKFSDQTLLETCSHLEKINVQQAYTRCNVLALENDRFITSDRGIEKELQKNGLEVLYVNPEGILLPEFEHGFLGGTCGIHENRIFFIGRLIHFPEGEKVRQFLSDYEIIELYNGYLFDGGSLIFVA